MTRPWMTVLVVLVLLGSAACGDEADPGNRRLEALERDPVLGVVPEGAEIVETHAQPASDAGDVFNFPPSSARVSQVYRITGDLQEARRAFRNGPADYGWEFRNVSHPQGQRYASFVFTKDMGGWDANLFISQFDPDELTLTLVAPPVDRDGG